MEAIATQNGGIVSRYAYDAFGNVVERTEGAYASRVLYCGYKFDAESELYYLNARYYDAETARFITADSYMGAATAPQTLNRYSYCVNEPLRHWDPTGHVVTAYDAAHCSAYQQALLAQYTNMWNAANAKHDAGGMALAHKLAEQIRSCSGYSTNASGMGIYDHGRPVAYNNSAIYLSNTNFHDIERLEQAKIDAGNEGFEVENTLSIIYVITSGAYNATGGVPTDTCIGIRQATELAKKNDASAARAIAPYANYADSLLALLGSNDELNQGDQRYMKEMFSSFIACAAIDRLSDENVRYLMLDKGVPEDTIDISLQEASSFFNNIILRGTTLAELQLAYSTEQFAISNGAITMQNIARGKAIAAQRQAERNAKDVPTNIKVDDKYGSDKLVVRDKKYLDANGNIDWNKWAPNGGRVPGSEKPNQSLKPGTIIDRYGYDTGKYVSPFGTPYEKRALPYFENPNAYHKYVVLEPINGVTTSVINRAFGQPGGGIQYELPMNIKYLINNGFLMEI